MITTYQYSQLLYDFLYFHRAEEKVIEKETEISLSEAAIDAEWKRIQKKTFTRWCNEHLKKISPDHLIEEIGADFSDGLRLILLLEVLSQKKVGRYNKKPRVHAQRMENIELALDFIMKKENIYLVNIGEWEVQYKILSVNELLESGAYFYKVVIGDWEECVNPVYTFDPRYKIRSLACEPSNLIDVA